MDLIPKAPADAAGDSGLSRTQEEDGPSSEAENAEPRMSQAAASPKDLKQDMPVIGNEKSELSSTTGARDLFREEQETEKRSSSERSRNADERLLTESQAERSALEQRAIAKAAASADAAYVPSPSLLNSASPYPLLRQVDGPSLDSCLQNESLYMARAVPVPIRGRLNVPIHVATGGSVVEYTVESDQYDIAFGIVAEREEGITIVAESARVDSHITPLTGKFLVGSVPCALIFSFGNEYSWFREKYITYRIVVKPPNQSNIIAGRRRRAKSALRAVAEDKTATEERLTRTTREKNTLVAEIIRMEKELEEKRKSLDVMEREEGWLKKRVELRGVQETMLTKRLKNGWADEKEGGKEVEEEMREDQKNGKQNNARAEI